MHDTGTAMDLLGQAKAHQKRIERLARKIETLLMEKDDALKAFKKCLEDAKAATESPEKGASL